MYMYVFICIYVYIYIFILFAHTCRYIHTSTYVCRCIYILSVKQTPVNIFSKHVSLCFLNVFMMLSYVF